MATWSSAKDCDLNYILAPEVRLSGFHLEEVADHVLHLYHHNKLIARFLQSGVSIEDILKEVQDIETRSKN